MKVLLIDVNCKSGSTGKITYDLHKKLIKDGYQSVICYGRGKKIQEEHIYKISTSIEVYFHALMTRITGLTGCFSFFSTHKLMRFIKKFKPDVVHIHELHGYFVNIKPVINYLKENKIKTIWTFHCEFMYTGRCGNSCNCVKWKTQCGNCPNINEYPASLFFDFSKKMWTEKEKMFKGFDTLTIVTPSKWLNERARKSFLYDKPILIVNNGIDTKKTFYPRANNSFKEKLKLANEKIVLAVAPDIMQERKGGKWILKLAEKFNNEQVHFILVGVEDMNYVAEQNVTIIHRTENQDELAQYYSMADVFVICSVIENFPTVCLEALACGTPICGFDVGGTKETAPGELGTFVPYGDIEALSEAVRDRLNKGKDSERCAEYARQNYSKEKMYEEYKKLYLA